MTLEQTKGMVLRIERSSIHDGDGMRTVVFLKGCPLRCQWCSTPESQAFQVETTVDGSKSYGTEMTVTDVMKEVRKDTAFYFISGGGMTLSGGELLAQPDFSLALLKAASMEGISTAVETSFFGKLLPLWFLMLIRFTLISKRSRRAFTKSTAVLIIASFFIILSFWTARREGFR